jgi:hypothetical protein
VVYYVPGTEEKDTKKVIMSLQQAHENIATNTADIATNTADIAALEAGVGLSGAGFGGRLTLTSGTAITTSDVAGATSIYYTPSSGVKVPIYDGSLVTQTTFSELTLALDSDSGHTGYHQSTKQFDLFVINDSSTIRLGSGPAWSSDTARGTGAGTTELQFTNGFWSNANTATIRFGSSSGNTVSVAAGRATYVGSFRASANGQVTDSAGFRFLFNAYNTAWRSLYVTDAGVSWNYSTASFQQVNANSANLVQVFAGLAGGYAQIRALSAASGSAADQSVSSGVGVNSLTVNSADTEFVLTGGPSFTATRATLDTYLLLGINSYVWLERGNGAGTQTFYGTNGGAQIWASGLRGGVWL